MGICVSDTSVKHSPNFDWVVAHVGSCFPKTVITRVLSCGLKDFCQNKSYEQGCNSPKLRSVVGILGHLAGSHSEDIQKALLDLFNVMFETAEIRRNFVLLCFSGVCRRTVLSMMSRGFRRRQLYLFFCSCLVCRPRCCHQFAVI